MSDNMNVLLVGCGNMGKEYAKVLCAQNINIIAVGNSEEGAKEFTRCTGIEALSGGIDTVISSLDYIPRIAIIATPVISLGKVVIQVINHGVKRVLVEKPAGLSYEEILEVSNCAKRNNAKVFVAYNRRFYSSVDKALDIIDNDGGVTSFSFEFTEWAHTIEKIKKPESETANWLLANSTHVIDLAFFLGGEPKEMCSYVSGGLKWHQRGAVYSGAGISNSGALFSYAANWDAPGRWAVEVLTHKHRLYFKPMEKLAIQNIDSVQVDWVEIDDKLDVEFKPGLYKQVEAFLNENKQDERLLDIDKQLDNILVYEKIAGIRRAI